AYVSAVSCSDCRFKQRALAPASPGAVIRSLFVSLTGRSTPRSSPSPTSPSEGDASEGEQWRLAAADLSRRLGRRGGGDLAAEAVSRRAGAQAGA
ncbi:hypothetical protein CFC21_025443, partial [Triticum aestivum]